MNLLLYFYLYDVEYRKLSRSNRDSILDFSACHYDPTEQASKSLTKIPVKRQGCTMQGLFLTGAVTAQHSLNSLLFNVLSKIIIKKKIPCFFFQRDIITMWAAIDNEKQPILSQNKP